MVKKRIRSLDDAPVDVFEAVKRALIRRGVVRGRRSRPSKPQSLKPKNNKNPKNGPQSNEEPKNAILNPDVTIMVPEEDPELLVNLTQNSQETLAEASTVFPLTLIPDTISVDREKVTIATRSFIRMANVNSVPVTDIQSVEVDVGPFFGTLKITSKYFVNNRREVDHLWRGDAVKIHHLLQGLILANQRHVDINTLDKEQLLILLNDLGQGVSD